MELLSGLATKNGQNTETMRIELQKMVKKHKKGSGE